MAYGLVVAGALMALSGLYFMVTGWGIVQVEQGWAAVISGATLVGAGFVTAALGLVLRALTRLTAVRIAEATSIPAPVAFAPVVEPVEPPTIVPVAPPADLRRDPISAPEPDLPPPPAPSFAETSLEPEPVPPPPPEPVGEPRVESAPETASYAHEVEPDPAEPPAVDRRDHFAEAANGSDAAPPAIAERVQEPAPEPEPERREPPQLSAMAPESAREEPASPPIDDWLDRAFAEIDREDMKPTTAPTQVEPMSEKPIEDAPAEEPPAPERPLRPRLPKVAVRPPKPVVRPVRAPREPAMAESEPAPAAAEALPEPPAPPPAAAPEPTSAVVGRYEADGTLYVMYADGSIEAQFEGGVYRFASMAELKTFIES